MRRRKLLISLIILATLSMLAGVGARVLAGHRFRIELAQSRTEMEAGLMAMARNRLARLAEQWPEEGEVAYQLGRCEAARGRGEAAMEAWARIPIDSPWAAPAALEFAQAAIPLGRITEAERVLRQALQRHGLEVPALRHLLLILLEQQGRIDEGRRLIEDLWDETAIVPLCDRADRLVMLHEHVGLDLVTIPLEGNLGRLEAIAAPTGEDDRRAMGLARAYQARRAGDFRRAEGELRSCLERWPYDPWVWKSWLDWAVAADRVEPARMALAFVPARLLDSARLLELRAWFARQRHDARAEKKTLEALLTMEPGRTATLMRLAELHQQLGHPRRAAELRRRKAELDAALDRYFRFFREDRYADHLPELVTLAERLERTFEARGFWEIVRSREPSNDAAQSALARLRTATREASPPVVGTLAQVLEAGEASPSPNPADVPRPGDDRVTSPPPPGPSP